MSSLPQSILFIGDSITDCARREHDVPFGVGYVRMFSDLMSFRKPAQRITIINRGISGHTVDDLRSRWTDHVLANVPDQLVIKIGINDINRWLCGSDANPKQSPEQYAAIYDQILSITRREIPHTKILLITPFFASREKNPEAYRYRVLSILPDYIEIVRSMAKRYDTNFLDLHAAIQDLLAAGFSADSFAEDSVHPSTAGALFIAEQIYTALAI